MHKDDEIDVMREIAIDIVPYTPIGGWVHTHGMHRFGLPELEIRGVQEFFLEDAARMLHMLAGYMLNSGLEVSVGQHLQFSDMQRFALIAAKPLKGAEHHYEHQRWTMVEPVQCTCSRCISERTALDGSAWQDHNDYFHVSRVLWPTGEKHGRPN